METKQFDKVLAHEQEIAATRVGGLGGSDAAMVLKIGRGGSLSKTNEKRLAVMLGQIEYEPIPGNAAMQAGHLFEDYVERDVLQEMNTPYEREVYMSKHLCAHFNTFAHADFASRVCRESDNYLTTDGCHVIECKYSQLTTDEVKERYAAQLQWYYLMGAQSVRLIHGQGSIEPFEVGEATVAIIDRDEDIIRDLAKGLEILDELVPTFCYKGEEMVEEQLPAPVRGNVIACRCRLEQIKQAEEAIARMKQELLEWMEANDILTIDAEGCKVTYISPSVRRTFDSKKAIAAHPELDSDEFYKTSNVKSSITIKLK